MRAGVPFEKPLRELVPGNYRHGGPHSAFIQIDDNTPIDRPPFTNDPSTWDLTADIGLSAGKDYTFFAAICGIRGGPEVEPLYPLRGLPPTKDRLDPVMRLEGDYNVSWLTLSAIRHALRHMGTDEESLSRPVKLVLRTMEVAEAIYGTNRVRLVFQVID